MLKGISQESRNNAWHKRHTKKKSLLEKNRLVRLAEYRAGNPIKKKNEAERQFKEAQLREKLKFVGFWGRIKLFFQRLFNSNAGVRFTNTTGTNA